MMPAKPKSVHVYVALRECLGFHEAFRRLGYPPSAILIALHAAEDLNGAVIPWCVLKSPALPKPVNMACGVRHFDLEEQEEFLELWPKYAVAWNETMTHEERVAIWRLSYVPNHAADFMRKMLELGHREPINSGVLA